MHKLEYEKGGVIEVNAVQQDGQVFPVELAISEAEQGEDTFYLTSFRDITERRRVEQIKNEFIATVSHELRTPLTSIAGALKLSIHNFSKHMPAKCLQLIDIAERNTQRLIKLVNDILDIEKLEAGKMVFNNADFILRDVVVDAIDGISPMAKDKKVIVQLEDKTESVALHTDAFRLGQVLNNLLSNAIKFSPVDASVLVRILPGEIGVRIEVSDNGPGIPENFIPLVFSKFSQATGVGFANKGGTGLGLSIVKQIIEQMDGRIGFTTSSSGTIFYIELPIIGGRSDAPVEA
ncbi:sensor histidine kinase [Advenella sp. RU8]|uniref:sensor histidine kinase n=1 Tax=Advenella sp. RU8 TaxID=3399575 RepID=UPI003AAE1BEA